MAETGTAGTSWSALSVDQMWAMVQGQNQAGYDRLIQGWQQAADVAKRHIDYLEDYQDRLAVAWPPSSSDAARACHGQLDVMIQNMRETWSTAVSNRSTLETTASALDAAHTRMELIQQEYAQNRISLAEYDQQVLATVQQYAGRPVAAPPSPVPDGRQAALEAEARAVMSSLSTDLAVAKSMIRTPPKYVLSPDNAESDDFSIGGAGLDDGTVASPGRQHLSLSTLKDQQRAAGSAAKSPGGDAVVGQIPGPVLVGIEPSAGGVPSTAPGALPQPPGQRGLPAEPAFPAPIGPGGQGGAGTRDQLGRSGPTTRPVPGAKAMTGEPIGRSPAGLNTGVIGAPGSGPGQTPGGRAGTARGVQRVNPVGGVLGETPSPSRAKAGQGFPGAVNSRSPRHGDAGDDRNGRRWDPDNPWETDIGVAPLLDASPAAPIVPGPVIGLDRS